MFDIIQQRIEIFTRVLQEIPELRYAGDPAVRQKTSMTTVEEGLPVAERMKLVLQKYREITRWGRGLAAPQIGESLSVFITFIDEEFEVFINPQIIEKSNTTNFYKEVCMSVAVMAADVERPESIVMEWMDEHGKQKLEKFDGFKARLYQHEEAHLRGRLNIDDAIDGGIEFVTFDPLKEELRNINKK